jgi:hypothetical protein
MHRVEDVPGVVLLAWCTLGPRVRPADYYPAYRFCDRVLIELVGFILF